ncbi:unnamed protein product, partial [Effrenium voratum]
MRMYVQSWATTLVATCDSFDVPGPARSSRWIMMPRGLAAAKPGRCGLMPLMPGTTSASACARSTCAAQKQQGQTPWRASSRRHQLCVARQSRFRRTRIPRYQAAFDGDVARLADLLEDEDVDVCCRDHNLQTPLMLAALGGSLECVEYLVDARADVAAVDRQKD